MFVYRADEGRPVLLGAAPISNQEVGAALVDLVRAPWVALEPGVVVLPTTVSARAEARARAFLNEIPGPPIPWTVRRMETPPVA